MVVEQFGFARLTYRELIAGFHLHLFQNLTTDTHLQIECHRSVAQLVGTFVVTCQNRNHRSGKCHRHQSAFKAIEIVVTEFQVDGNVDVVKRRCFGT